MLRSQARDNLVNDSFSAYSVRATKKDFKLDMDEIHVATWFSIDALLGAWVKAGRDQGNNKHVKISGLSIDAAADKGEDANVRLCILVWLDRPARALECRSNRFLRSGTSRQC